MAWNNHCILLIIFRVRNLVARLDGLSDRMASSFSWHSGDGRSTSMPASPSQVLVPCSPSHRQCCLSLQGLSVWLGLPIAWWSQGSHIFKRAADFLWTRSKGSRPAYDQNWHGSLPYILLEKSQSLPRPQPRFKNVKKQALSLGGRGKSHCTWVCKLRDLPSLEILMCHTTHINVDWKQTFQWQYFQERNIYKLFPL